MLRNEASIRELFYQSYVAHRSFVHQDDRKIKYIVLKNETSIHKLCNHAIKSTE